MPVAPICIKPVISAQGLQAFTVIALHALQKAEAPALRRCVLSTVYLICSQSSGDACAAAVHRTPTQLDSCVTSESTLSSTVLRCFQTGKAHAQAGEHEAAEASYCRAQEQSNRLMKDLDGADLPEAQLCEIMTGCLDLLLDRLVNAWKLQQQVCNGYTEHGPAMAQRADL